MIAALAIGALSAVFAVDRDDEDPEDVLAQFHLLRGLGEIGEAWTLLFQLHGKKALFASMGHDLGEAYRKLPDDVRTGTDWPPTFFAQVHAFTEAMDVAYWTATDPEEDIVVQVLYDLIRTIQTGAEAWRLFASIIERLGALRKIPGLNLNWAASAGYVDRGGLEDEVQGIFERQWNVPNGPVDEKRARTLVTRYKTKILYEAVPWYDGWHLKTETRYKGGKGGIGYDTGGPFEEEAAAWEDGKRVRLTTQLREVRERQERRS